MNESKIENSQPTLQQHNVMCCFNEMTVNELKNKLSKSWVEDTYQNGQLYRKYLTKNQVEQVLKIVLKNNT